MKGRTVNRAVWAFGLVLGAFIFTAADASAGQFKRPAYYRAGRAPYQAVATQLTRSGNLDLVMADYLSNQIIVLLGKGEGNFERPIAFAAPAPIGLAVGDLNGDGNEDLLVVESGGTGSGALAVFLGHGDGRFSFKATYQLGSQAGFVTTADFDADGKLDVAETDAGDGSEGVLRVFRGTGEGTLLKPTVYKIPDTPGALAAADLNGDHHPDLAVTQFSNGSVAVLLNDGTGKFLKPVSYNAAGGEVVDVKIADLRNSGDQDLVIANLSAGMVVLLNKGDGTFGKPRVYQPTFFDWQPPEACTVADFNLDGKLDVACVANYNSAYFFYGEGDGTFHPGIAINETINNNGGFGIASGDFNHDKAPDLAIPIQNYGKVAILLNTQ